MDVDGEVVGQSFGALVQIKIHQPPTTSVLSTRQSIAFRGHTDSNRYLGTVTAIEGPNLMSVLLDRIAMTEQIAVGDARLTNPPQPPLVNPNSA